MRVNLGMREIMCCFSRKVVGTRESWRWRNVLEFNKRDIDEKRVAISIVSFEKKKEKKKSPWLNEK